MEDVLSMAQAGKEAARRLRSSSIGQRNGALELMACSLERAQSDVIEANAIDVQRAAAKGLPQPLQRRLGLDPTKLSVICEGLRALIDLPDPLGEVREMVRRPNGLQIGKMRVPLGLIGMIYEARPNVTVDAAGLTLKSGNAVLLRGGSEAMETNRVLGAILQGALVEAGLPAAAIQVLTDPGREVARTMMGLTGLLDVLIPRGGADLIQTVVREAKVPVIETGVGNCHVYVDGAADLEMARKIITNAKCSYPAVCNAAETLLVDQAVAAEFLPIIGRTLQEAGVELRGCPQTLMILPWATLAQPLDWETEFLDLILAVKVVDGLEGALEHIAHYSTGHSEAIVTRDYFRAQRFLNEIDAAAVYVNASTRFTDGGEFGLGAEIGISTQKLHARGPMGLGELTTYKWIIFGTGQVRE